MNDGRERRRPGPRVDADLASLLAAELEGTGIHAHWAQPHGFFYVAVERAGDVSKDHYKAVQYANGLLRYQLGLKDRRPARGWGRTSSICPKGRFDDETYRGLELLVGQVADLFYALMEEVDGCPPAAARLIDGCEGELALQALERLRARRCLAERGRVSALAA